MLTQIVIRDFATIDEVTLDLSKGLTMITGETGAGKSIFIEAIEIALGGRASANMVRLGQIKAEISLVFNISHFPKVMARLQSLDLAATDNSECFIRRVIMLDGRSRSYLNGTPTTLQFMKELGELLFHMHSQHEQQIVLKNDVQREMLDRFANTLTLVSQLNDIATAGKTLKTHIDLLKQKMQTSAEKESFLRFQLEELQTTKLQANEWEKLEAEHSKLIHADELQHTVQRMLLLINDDNAPDDLLKQLSSLRKMIESTIAMEPKATSWAESIKSLVILLRDMQAEFTDYLQNMVIDADKIQQIENRVSHIYNISRKYKINPQELVSFKEKIAQELQTIENYEDALNELTHKHTLLCHDYSQLAENLSQQRKKHAASFEKIITHTIRSLSLPHGEFKIAIEDDSKEFNLHGQDKIIFTIKTNPDQLLQPLTKVISGGELSRLSLAIHLALAHQTSIPTLIYDEIDTGLGGATAEKIGKLLRQLGQSYQVFCVTHQAQVAAYGNEHLLVEKHVTQQKSFTKIKILSKKARAAEIARMLGGEKITPKTMAHAQEILSEQ